VQEQVLGPERVLGPEQGRVPERVLGPEQGQVPTLLPPRRIS